MKTIDKTSSDILNEAATLLELDIITWNQGAYFKSNSNDQRCAMCAHGVIAYCANHAVKRCIDDLKDLRWAADAMVWVELATRAVEKEKPSSWFKNNPVYFVHYQAAKAGLTFEYNDNSNTTKQDVVNKLREAAQLAAEI